MLGGELAAVGLGDDAALGDGDQRIVGVVVLALGEVRLVGGHERNVAGIGELDQRAFGDALARRAVALQLHVKPVAEQFLQRRAAGGGEVGLAGQDRGVERAARPAGERDQAVGHPFEPGKLQMRLFVRRGLQERARAELHQAAIARLAGGQQHDPRQRPHLAGEPRVARLVAEIERQGAADDRLDAIARKLFGELERPEHVVGVGQRQRRLVVRLGELGKPADDQRAFEQRISGMHVQMHEARISGHGGLNDSVSEDGGDARLPCPHRSRTVPAFLRAGTDGVRLRTADRRHGSGTGQALFPMPSTSDRGWGSGREYPRQTGMTSGWGTAKTKTSMQRYERNQSTRR